MDFLNLVLILVYIAIIFCAYIFLLNVIKEVDKRLNERYKNNIEYGEYLCHLLKCLKNKDKES